MREFVKQLILVSLYHFWWMFRDEISLTKFNLYRDYILSDLEVVMNGFDFDNVFKSLSDHSEDD